MLKVEVLLHFKLFQLLTLFRKCHLIKFASFFEALQFSTVSRTLPLLSY